MDHAERMRRFEATDLYVVITEEFCAGRSSLDVLDSVLSAGVKLIQFREKHGTDRARFARAAAFRDATRSADALLIIDDRVDIAMAVEADGVHLGQDDLPLQAARHLAPELVIGASTHNLQEALAAQDAGASYVNIGPVFTTHTKAVPTGTVGPEMLDVITPHLRIPFTTMGGIKEHNIDAVLSRGARHVAVVTAVTAAPDPGAAAWALRSAMRAFHQQASSQP